MNCYGLEILDPKAKDLEREMVKNKKFIFSKGTVNGSGGRKTLARRRQGHEAKIQAKSSQGRGEQ